MFSGRETITIRKDGQISFNRNITNRYLDDHEEILLAHDEESDRVAVIPLEESSEEANTFSLQGGKSVSVSAKTFLKDIGEIPEESTKYVPEWNESLGGDTAPGGLIVDLTDEGEEVV